MSRVKVDHIISGLIVEDTPWRGSIKRLPLAERMEHHAVPGISVAVINDFTIEWAQGYGVLESGKHERVDEHTLFQAGSISKPVTAVAAMRLVEKGLLSLDEVIFKSEEDNQVVELVVKQAGQELHARSLAVS